MKQQINSKERLNAWVSPSTLSLIKIYAAAKHINLSEATEEVIKQAIGHIKVTINDSKGTDLRSLSGIIKDGYPTDLSEKHNEYTWDE